nr:hypothetical protein [Streptomyces sp. CBMA152]
MACVTAGAAVVGCSGGGTGKGRSAEELLRDANSTMGALRSVTIDSKSTGGTWGTTSSHHTTDLKHTCATKTTWASGAVFEQIRIGDTDYARPNAAYLKAAGHPMTGARQQSRWVKTLTSEATPGDGLVECTREFASFGKARQSDPVDVDGTRTIPLQVTDDADKGGTYTFYVAAEGKPYILKVLYKGAKLQSTTSFSAFDKPLDVRALAATEVVDMG